MGRALQRQLADAPAADEPVNSTTTFLVVVLIYVILGLLEVDDVARKLGAMEGREIGRVVLDGSVKTAAKLRRFMLVRTLMSALTGVLVWAFASFLGIELANEYVIAFASNDIPVIGPLIATVFPTLFAMGQFACWQMALVVFACA